MGWLYTVPAPGARHAYSKPNLMVRHVLVDASAIGAGAMLVQEDVDGVNHPVSYFSRKFNKHQVHYSTIEQETLCCGHSSISKFILVPALCQYLYSQTITLSHSSLICTTTTWDWCGGPKLCKIITWIYSTRGSEIVCADALSSPLSCEKQT